MPDETQATSILLTTYGYVIPGALTSDSYRVATAKLLTAEKNPFLVLGDESLSGFDDAFNFVRVFDVDRVVELDFHRDDLVMVHLDRGKHLAVSERAHGVGNVPAEHVQESTRGSRGSLLEAHGDDHVHVPPDRFSHWYGRAVNSIAYQAALKPDRRQHRKNAPEA